MSQMKGGPFDLNHHMIVILHVRTCSASLWGLRLGGCRSEFDHSLMSVRRLAIGQFERMCHVTAPGGRIKLEEDLQHAIGLETADSGHRRRRLMNAGSAIE